MSSDVLAVVLVAFLVFSVLAALRRQRDWNAEMADAGARQMEADPESRDLRLDYLYGVSGMALSRQARQAVFAKSLAILAAHTGEPDFQQAFLQYFTRCRWRGREREAARHAVLGLLREDSPPNVRRFLSDVARGHGRDVGSS